jgi:peptidoglycan/LPS O-acetylase OafA/YrhL
MAPPREDRLASNPRRLAYVDALRAVAILSVFFVHAPRELGHHFGLIQDFGGRGVDLFFVLSGFLIGTTSLARAELPMSLAQKAKTFWMLRTFRIWPLYFGLLALYVALPVVFGPGVRAMLLDYPIPYVSFTSN